MDELYIRTEDIKAGSILTYFVETKADRSIINSLKARAPAILVGSRGVGKSFLLRVAQAELSANFDSDRILPVYLSFSSSPLLQSLSDEKFNAWMLSKICSAIMREFSKRGVSATAGATLKILGTHAQSTSDAADGFDVLLQKLENVWRNPGDSIDTSLVPDIDQVKDAIEQACTENNLGRIVLFIDEAAHIFLPRHQRLFFSMFRDLRSPYLNCKAAVYPGVTSYGSNFQPSHDAEMLAVERNVTVDDYVTSMKEIVAKQATPQLQTVIEQYGKQFSALAYAAYGNPRALLKSLNKLEKINTQSVNLYLREYYRAEIWSEHSLLGGKYTGHQPLIDWGRTFIEQQVLPAIQRKNNTSEGSSAYFWVHRDAPEFVRQALGILKYTGIVREHLAGSKNGQGAIGTKYMINLGCIFALSTNAIDTGIALVDALDDKRLVEFGKNDPAFVASETSYPSLEDDNVGRVALEEQLKKSIDHLDLTDFQNSTLKAIKVLTIADVLASTEAQLQQAPYVGEVRSRRIRNAAVAAVSEYLSG